MKKGFVVTENFRRLADAHRAVDRRGAAEAGLVVIKGPYGVGKSKLVERWSVDNGAIFVRCKETWTRRALLDEVADCIGLDTRGRNSEVQARIISRLATNPTPMVFDEADHLVRSTPALLECVRDITDVTGVTCFLVGMERFGDRLARYGHIASRVARIVELQPATLADVKAAAKQLCEIPLDDEVVAQLHQQSQGRMRLVLNGIANIELWAAANGWRAVAGENVRGKALCVEFKGRQPGRHAEAA